MMISGVSKVVATIIAIAILAGCGSSDSATQTSLTTVASQSGATKPTITVPSTPPPTNLQTKDIVVGTGPEARSGNRVAVHYVGANYTNGNEFDASWDSQPFTFKLGQGNVIEGWDKGIVGMKVGGQRELIIPPEMAYGAEGSPPVIGPNETLVFIVDLLAVK